MKFTECYAEDEPSMVLLADDKFLCRVHYDDKLNDVYEKIFKGLILVAGEGSYESIELPLEKFKEYPQ